MSTRTRARRKAPGSSIKVRGFFRVNILENGKVVGDSGWNPNTITDNGYSNYLLDLLGKSSSSKRVELMCLGTGTAPNATHNTLNGELNTATYSRTAVTYANVSSRTARFTATFASSSSHIVAATTLQNIGIINSTTSGGTLMAGNTYATSQWNTNQDLQATYEIRFS